MSNFGRTMSPAEERANSIKRDRSFDFWQHGYGYWMHAYLDIIESEFDRLDIEMSVKAGVDCWEYVSKRGFYNCHENSKSEAECILEWAEQYRKDNPIVREIRDWYNRIWSENYKYAKRHN